MNLDTESGAEAPALQTLRALDCRWQGREALGVRRFTAALGSCSLGSSGWNRPDSRGNRGTVRGDSRSYASKHPRAFTLIELLVVLGVIGVLAALLLPTLARSRAAAQRLTCVHNLHQLGLAARMYWDDNDGRAFRYRGAATNGGDLYWFGWLARGAEGERGFDPAKGALFPYLDGRGVETCPSLNYALSAFKMKARGAAYGYGYNFHLSTPASQPPIWVSHVARPSEVALLADSAQVNTFQAPASPENPMLEKFYYINTSEPTVHFRHTRRANVAFCDGHVAPESPVPGSLDLRLRTQIIGRLRPEILMTP